MINRFVIAILLITTLIVATPSAAFANPPDIDTLPTAEYERESRTFQFGGVLRQIGKLFNAGNLFSTANPNFVMPPSVVIGVCTQRSNDPHPSFHFPGTVAGEVTSRCRGKRLVPLMSFTAYLGVGTREENIRDVRPLNLAEENNHIFVDNHVWKGEAVADTYCRDRWYKTRGEGFVVYTANGRPRYWWTASPAVNNPCGL